jgi:hypothetical protein
MNHQFGSITVRLGAFAAMQVVDDQGTVAMCQASSAFSAARFHGSFIALRPDGVPMPRWCQQAHFRPSRN